MSKLFISFIKFSKLFLEMKKRNLRSVASKIYSSKYFLQECGGWDKYKDSGGRELPKRLKICLDYARLSKNDVVLDLGCGRGESTCNAGIRAQKVIGIDYSEDAIRISKKTLENFLKSRTLKKNKVKFIKMNATKLKFPEKYFDKILIFDLIEHLNPSQVDKMLEESKRILKENGLIIIHTMPNRLFYSTVYPLIRLLFPILKNSKMFQNLINTKPNWKELGYLPKEPRADYDQKVHVNEFTYFSLKKTLEKHNLIFEIKMLFLTQDYGENKFLDFISGIIPRLWPLNYFLCVDLIAISRKV